MASMEALIILIGIVLGFVIFYYLLHAAVLSALNDHYKSRRHFEETGEWKYGHWSNKTDPKKISKS